MEIYQPEEDSYLLSKYAKQLIKPKDKVLDMGCGSGIQSETALNNKADVIGIDINPNAVKHCKTSKYTKKAKFFVSDLFNKFNNSKNKFDIILFNPPYLPDENDPEEIKAYTTGGKHGWEIIEKFITNADTHLKNEGMILMVFSNLTIKKKVDEILINHLFEYQLLEEKSIFFEKLYCYKITKSEFLKSSSNKNIKNISYLSKGKRGIVYKCKYNNKSAVIKYKNTKSKANNAILFEAKWLKEVNKLKIGPKLYYNDNEIVIMEFIDGYKILDFCKNNKLLTKKIIIDVLKQMHILDIKKIEKREMRKPYKHIIIKKNKPHKPILIDFERMHYTKNPSNVNQFIQFILHSELNLNLNKDKIMLLGREYKQNYNLKQIKDYILNNVD
jgi:release factor glutamine methyltransferase